MMQAKGHLMFWGRSWRPIEAQASRRSRIYSTYGIFAARYEECIRYFRCQIWRRSFLWLIMEGLIDAFSY